jgi:hypothetical protein
VTLLWRGFSSSKKDCPHNCILYSNFLIGVIRLKLDPKSGSYYASSVVHNSNGFTIWSFFGA